MQVGYGVIINLDVYYLIVSSPPCGERGYIRDGEGEAGIRSFCLDSLTSFVGKAGEQRIWTTSVDN